MCLRDIYGQRRPRSRCASHLMRRLIWIHTVIAPDIAVSNTDIAVSDTAIASQMALLKRQDKYKGVNPFMPRTLWTSPFPVLGMSGQF